MPDLKKLLTLEALSEALPSWLKRSTKPEYNADEIDSANTTNQFVSASDKDNWNAKGTYSKPSGGIPKSDLSSIVQTSLEKADSALQSETDPTVPSWAKQTNKPSYTQDEVADGSTYKRVTQTEKDTWSGKQNALTTPQMRAVNSGITSEKVTQISTNQTNILSVENVICDTEFSTSTAYAVGDIVTYEHGLYEFTTAHSAGAWNSNEVSQIDVVEYIDSQIPTVMGASGSSHKGGLVPDTPSTAGTSKFLREDGTWAAPSGGGGAVNTVYVGTTQYPPDSNGKVSLPAYPTTLPADGGTASNVSGTVTIAHGGTGSTTASGARSNLGLGTAATKDSTTSVTSGSSALVTSGAVYSGLAKVSKNIARVERNFTSTPDVLSSTGCKYTTQSNKVYRITAWAEYSSTNPLAVAIVNSTNGAVFGYAEYPSTSTNIRVAATALIIGAEVVEIKAKYAGSATCAVGMIIEELSGV